jgi:asparagine synthase (glutamine-hydrolysing)
MCGILGNYGSSSDDFMKVTSLEDIGHRGPDSMGNYKNKNVYLGHTRLSILDVSERGNQPMFSEDGQYIIIFNGEIYNHLELRKAVLSDVEFNSTCDTETVLKGLIKEGKKFIDRLNGIFAFSFYNLKTNDFIIVRDHFGIKPLYYYKSEKEISFSSELKAINGFVKNKSINTKALRNYVNFLWSPGEDTPINEIKKLLPGHYLSGNVNDIKNIKSKRFYSIPFRGDYFQKKENEIVDLLEAKLVKAVERQMLSDVPIGFFLSGGLDSSLLVAIAKKLYPEKSMECFTIKINHDNKEGFSDDLHYAEKVAKYLNVNLNIVEANVDIMSSFDKLIYHLDEPQSDPAPINILNICNLAKSKGIKVLIGGTAGDDLFSGYRRHQALRFEKYFEAIPLLLRKGIKKISSKLDKRKPIYRRFSKLVKDIDKSKEARLLGYFDWIDKDTLSGLFIDKIKDDKYAFFKELSSLIPEGTKDLNKMLFWELNTFLVDHNLNYTDKASMATGVEVRVPFLDKDLVEFSTLIPPELKMKGSETKYILKKVAERYLPNEVIYRSKTGFGAPIRTWILNDMSALINQYLNKKTVVERGIFDYEKIEDLIEKNRKGLVDASYTIWSLLAIESWMRQFYDEKK